MNAGTLWIQTTDYLVSGVILTGISYLP